MRLLTEVSNRDVAGGVSSDRERHVPNRPFLLCLLLCPHKGRENNHRGNDNGRREHGATNNDGDTWLGDSHKTHSFAGLVIAEGCGGECAAKLRCAGQPSSLGILLECGASYSRTIGMSTI